MWLAKKCQEVPFCKGLDCDLERMQIAEEELRWFSPGAGEEPLYDSYIFSQGQEMTWRYALASCSPLVLNLLNICFEP